MVEKPFNVIVSRVHREGKSRYGQSVTWVDYRLNRTEYNAQGIEKMVEYISKESKKTLITTDAQKKQMQDSVINPIFTI